MSLGIEIGQMRLVIKIQITWANKNILGYLLKYKSPLPSSAEQSGIQPNNKTEKKEDDKKDKNGDVFMSASSAPSTRHVDTWFIDLRATQHMCVNQASFTNYVYRMSSIYLGDSTPIKVVGRRHVTLRLQGSTITFTNILHVLFLTTNLLSVSALLSKECKVHFEKARCTIHCPNESHLATRKQEGNLFHLIILNHAFVITGLPKALLIKLWHQRLDHLRLDSVQKLQNNFIKICLD